MRFSWIFHSSASKFFACAPFRQSGFASFVDFFSSMALLAVVLSLFSVFWRRLLQHNFVVIYCSEVRQRRSSQQRGLLFVASGFTPSGLGDSLPLRFVGGLQHHCVILWAVSTFSVRVFIAASGHGVVLWSIQHRWVVTDPRISLCRLTSLTEILASCAARFALCYMSLSCHFDTLLPFTCG